MKKLILSLLIMFIIFSCISFSNAISNNVDISGCVKTKDGKPIGNVKVEVISNGTPKYSTETDPATGEYQIKDVAKGKYSVKFEYESIYSNPEITLKKFETYKEKVELAYLYPDPDRYQNTISISDVKSEVNKVFDKGTPDMELDRPYYGGPELGSHINELELDENNKDAFQKTMYLGWKSVAIIISDYDKIDFGDIDKYVKGVRKTNYRYVIASTDESGESIANKVKNALSMTDSGITNVTDKITDSSAETPGIDFQEDANVNLTVEQEVLEGGDMTFVESDDILFNGKIFVNNEENSNKKVQVTLRSISSGKYWTKTVNGGEYNFNYPASNEGDKFRLEFVVNHKELNGQNYEIDSEHIGVESATINDNIAYQTQTNKEKLKENFKDIKIKQEKQIEKTESASSIGSADEHTKLLAETDEFTIVKYGSTRTVKKTIKNEDGEPEEVEEEEEIPLSNYSGALKLQEREKFRLTVEKYINNVKVLLADKSIFLDWNREKGEKVQYIANTDNRSIVTMDNEIRHGATLQVEYAIKITNNSNIDCNKFTIIDYLTYSGAKFVYNEELKSLSDGDKSNKSIGWQLLKPNELEAFLDYEPKNKDIATFLKYTGAIKKGETQTLYLTANTIMSTETDVNSQFYNEVELVQYSNDNSRRNYNNEGKAIKAGNYNIDNAQNEGTNMEQDSAKVIVQIVPPYGKGTQNNLKLITIVIVVIFILIIPKWKRGKNYDKKKKKH